MSQISIVTAQNVVLKIELANIGDRFLAAILDFLIKLGITIGALIVMGILSSSFTNFIMGSVMFVTWVFYSLLFEFFMAGQTPGKRIMEIRVARLDGGPITFGDLTLRWLLRLIDFPFGTQPAVGICVIVSTEKHQRLGDMAAATIVVSTKERTSFAETVYKEIPAGYIPVFPTVDRLTAHEVEIIKEVFYQSRQVEKYPLITLTAPKVKELLQADTNLDDRTFLRTVLKDYNATTTNEGNPFESRESFNYSL